MAQWRHRIKLKRLFTREEDHESVQASMNKIADAIEADEYFVRFSTKKFRKIPTGDDVITPVDYANKLINKMFDFADANKIWID